MKRILSLLLLTFSAMACILSISAPGMAALKDGTLIIAQGSDALYLDPQQQDEGPTWTVTSNIFDGLVLRKPDLSIEPGLAESWEQRDEVTWVFHLRKGVAFHSGNPFTADDAVFSIERQKKSKIASGLAAAIAEAKKIDDYTVEVTTHAPYAILLNNMVRIAMVDKKYIEQVGDEEFNLKPSGAGAYKVIEWVKEDHITLEANENYWKGAPKIKKVIFRPISNEATRVAALLSGAVHIIKDVPVRDADRIAKSDVAGYVGAPSLRTIYLTVDVSREKSPTIEGKNPLLDKRVREAFASAIDYNAIVRVIMNNHAFKAEQMNPKVIGGYAEGLKGYEFNLEKAKKLLADAGYADGFTITLDSPNNRYMNDFKIAEAIASQLAKVGIAVKLNLMPKSLFFDYIRSGEKTSLCLVGWSSDTGDAGNWFQSMFYTRNKKQGHGGSNRGHYSNPAFDDLIDKASSTASREERFKYLEEASRIIHEEMPAVPLIYLEDSYGVAKGISFTPAMDNGILACDVQVFE